jgi:DNA-binding transcriptional regulator YdaS (Cro superfamily)
VPQAAVGLADVATGGRVGKFLENNDGMVGFRPNEAVEALNQYLSPEQQAANKAVADASQGDEGDDQGVMSRALRVAKAVVQHPSVIAHTALQSLPSMGAGGVVGRGALALAPKLGAIASGIGEGVTTIGQQAEQIRTDEHNPDGLLTPMQSLLAIGSGAVTGAIGAGSGRLAQKLGIEEAHNLLTGIHADPMARAGFVRRVIGGAVTEGLLEELPQSVQEQVAQNMATGQPWDTGVDQQAVLGMFSGAAMGAGAQMFGGQKTHGDVIREDLQPEVGPLSKAVNAGIEKAAKQADANPPAAPADASEAARGRTR